MIVVVGEALVDLMISPSGEVDAALGGAPYNTARACGRLGAEVAFVGALSRDRFGRLLEDQLLADGVDVASAPRVDEPTTLAAAELDEHGAATYHFYIAGTSAPALVAVPSVEVDVLFTGGLGLVLEPMANTVEATISRSTGHAVVMVDVNCRPRVVPDRDRYVARVERVLEGTDIVKVSDDDLQYLWPELDPLVAGRSMLARGPRAVLLTAGAAGAHVLTDVGERFVPAEPVQVVDTVGAGDTFGAGFLAAWTAWGEPRALDDLDRLAAAAAFGARAAGVVCGRRGADPPWRHELD